MVLRWVLVLLFVWVAPAVAAPVIVTEVDRTIQNRLVRGWVAVVDLSDPTVEIVVTGPAPDGTGAEAVVARTDIWQ